MVVFDRDNPEMRHAALTARYSKLCREISNERVILVSDAGANTKSNGETMPPVKSNRLMNNTEVAPKKRGEEYKTTPR